MKPTASLLLLFSLCIWMATGCGTIVHGTMQDIKISSTPANATIWVDGAEKGKTPATVNLRRKDDHTIRIVKDGYKDVEVAIVSKTSGALFGNIFFGGLIGCIIDLSNGAAYTLSPDEITIDMTKMASLDGKTFYVEPDDLAKVKRLRMVNGKGETEFLLNISWQD